VIDRVENTVHVKGMNLIPNSMRPLSGEDRVRRGAWRKVSLKDRRVKGVCKR